MDDVMIRPMTEEDIENVSGIEKICFEDPWSEDSFRQEIDNILARYVVAEQDGRIIGFGGIWMIVGEAHLMNVAVLPEFRGHRIGEAIVRALMKTANEDMGIEEMTLEVRVSNHSAQALYRRLGFESAGIRPRYYENNREDAMIMWNHNILPYIN